MINNVCKYNRLDVYCNEQKKHYVSILLLCITVFFSPLRCYGIGQILVYTISLFKLFLIITTVTFVCSFLINDSKIQIDKYLVVMLLIFIYNIITLLYSNKKDFGLFPSYFSAYYFIITGYILLRKRIDLYSLILKSFIYSSFIPIYVCMYQFIMWKRNGIVLSYPLDRFVIAKQESIVLYGNIRIASTFLDPSYWGIYMVIIFIISLGVIVHYKYLENTNFKMNLYACYFLVPLSLICVFLSGSVSSILGIISGSLCLLIVSDIKNKSNVLLLIVFFTLLSIIIFSHFQDIDFYNIIINKISIQFLSLGFLFGRETYFYYALREFAQNPIFGIGYGNLYLTSAHNTLLTILAQHGIIGFMLHFCILFIFPLVQYKKYKNIKKNTLQKKYYILFIIIFSASFGMLVQSTVYDIIYKMDITSVLIMLLYVAMSNLNVINVQCRTL